MNHFTAKLVEPLFRFQDNKVLKAYRSAHGRLLSGLNLMSLTYLLSKLLLKFTGNDFGLILLVKSVFSLFNIFALMSIAYDLAKNYETSIYNTILLSFISFYLLLNQVLKMDPSSLSAYALVVLVPLISQFLMNALTYLFKTRTAELSKIFPDKILSFIIDLFTFVIALLLITLMVSIMQEALFFFLEAYLNFTLVVLRFFQNPIVFLLFLFLLNSLWYQGYHGDQIISIWFEPMIIIFTMLNLAHLIGLSDNTYIINATFYTAFSGVTGSGMTGAILVNLFLLGKKDLDIVKTSKHPAVFNINEMMMFGLPIVGNKTFKLPFLFAPLISATLAYMATLLGLMQPYMLAVPWYFPIGFKSYFATGGDLLSVLVEIMIFVIVVILYLPATKRYIRELDE